MFTHDVLLDKTLFRVTVTSAGDAIDIKIDAFVGDPAGTSFIAGVRSKLVGSLKGQFVGGQFVGIIPMGLHPQLFKVVSDGVAFVKSVSKKGK